MRTIKSLLIAILTIVVSSCGYDSSDFLKDFIAFSQDRNLTAQEYSVLSARVLQSASKGGFNFPYQGQFISIKSEQDLLVFCQTVNIHVENPRYNYASVSQMAQAFADEYIEIMKYGTLNMMIMENDMGESKNLEDWENRVEDYLETLNESQQEEFERVFTTTCNRAEMDAAFKIVGGMLNIAGMIH